MSPKPQFSAALVTFTEEILKRKLYSLRSEKILIHRCFPVNIVKVLRTAFL